MLGGRLQEITSRKDPARSIMAPGGDVYGMTKTAIEKEKKAKRANEEAEAKVLSMLGRETPFGSEKACVLMLGGACSHGNAHRALVHRCRKVWSEHWACGISSCSTTARRMFFMVTACGVARPIAL
jgi:hypothetical protein